ncbi:prepilin peptidase [Companilactobacillus metriopterae]|uniref:prepilin peptidase n=1 Tax=Companilactobacillus metriopterae TaxID=1909267 RepID=UPI00100B1468
MILFLFYVIIFFLGACCASFLAVIAQDFPNVNLTRRSSCSNCNKNLSILDLIPVFSYLFLLGKCSKCKVRIPYNTIIGEIFSGVFLFIIFYKHMDTLMYIPILLTLILLSYSDFFYKHIYTIYYLGFIPALFSNNHKYMLDCILVYIFLLLFSIISNGLGLGDVELCAILTLFFGYRICLFILLISCVLCILIFLTNKKRSFGFIPYITLASGIILIIFI